MKGRTIRLIDKILIAIGCILFIIGCAWSPIFKTFYIKYKTIRMTALTRANEN